MERQFDKLLLGSIELVCLSAELGSFKAAAVASGITPAAVSRTVARLEARLGVRLFARSTRSIRLTDAGHAYVQQCRHALSQLAEAERLVTGQQISPQGTISVSLPTTYGHYRVLPHLQAFRQRFPHVRLDFHISNRNIDFMEEGFDLAIRARPPSDSSLIARPLENAPLSVVASPNYLARAGEPQTLHDLANHDCIPFVLPSNGRQLPWEFVVDQRPVDVPISGPVSVAQDPIGGIPLALAGTGLLQTCRFLVEAELRDGRLVEVLQPYAGRVRAFHLIYPHGRYLPQRVRVFVDHLLAQAAEHGT